MPMVTFVVLPVFALANAGLTVSGGLAPLADPVALGVLAGLLLGKPLGVVGAAERIVQRVPVARSLYTSTKEVVASLAERPADAFMRVVLLEYPRRGIWSVGFVTGSVTRPGDDASLEDLLTVFVPTTPNPTSGFRVLVPRAETRELVLAVEQGVRLVISGGIVRPSSWGEPARGGAAG